MPNCGICDEVCGGIGQGPAYAHENKFICKKCWDGILEQERRQIKKLTKQSWNQK